MQKTQSKVLKLKSFVSTVKKRIRVGQTGYLSPQGIKPGLTALKVRLNVDIASHLLI